MQNYIIIITVKKNLVLSLAPDPKNKLLHAIYFLLRDVHARGQGCCEGKVNETLRSEH